MQATVRNFGAIELAALPLDKMTLLAGPNDAGKSSAIVAIGSALAGRPLPKGMTQEASKVLVLNGAQEAFAEVETDQGSVRATWPPGKIYSRGAPPRASLVAAGLLSPVDMDPRTRATYLADLIKASPTRDDLRAKLAEVIDDAALIEAGTDELWKLIEAGGWENALEKCVDRRRSLEAKWCDATGAKKYGSNIGATWRPADWRAELETLPVDALEARVTLAEQTVEGSVARKAVDAAEVDRRRTRAEQVPALAHELTQAEAGAQGAQKDLDEAVAKRAALPPDTHYLGVPCPHCGKRVVPQPDGKLTGLPDDAGGVSDAENKTRRINIAAADGTIGRLRAVMGQFNSELMRARVRLEEAQADAAWLADPANAPGQTNESALATARVTLAKAKADRDMRAAYDAAQSRHRSIQANVRIIEILQPTGLRATKLKTCLEIFNEQYLAPICEAAGWPCVTVSDDLEFMFGGRAYEACSLSARGEGSAQWRVRLVLQIVAAQLDGSDAILIDGADILVSKHRSGMFAALAKTGVPALVGMSFGKVDATTGTGGKTYQVPDLAAMGMGATYWLEKGIARPIGECRP